MSNNKFKVLIVEDEANICSFIETLLTTNDYQALVAHTCTMGLTLFASHNPDLVILDLGLPDRDGLEFIRTVRQKYMTPIVVLSARTDEMDKIEALDLGANDYITKPFNILEVKARIKAILRRNSKKSRQEPQQTKKVIEAGDLTLDSDSRRVFIASREINLTAKEFDLLELLVCNPGKVYSREELLRFVWGNRAAAGGDVRTVDVHVRRLREKIEPSPSDPKYVHTKWGVGYYFRIR